MKPFMLKTVGEEEVPQPSECASMHAAPGSRIPRIRATGRSSEMSLQSDEPFLQAHIRSQKQQQLEDILAASAISPALGSLYSVPPPMIPVAAVDPMYQVLRQQQMQTMAAASLVPSVPGVAPALFGFSPASPFLPQLAMDATLLTEQELPPPHPFYHRTPVRPKRAPEGEEIEIGHIEMVDGVGNTCQRDPLGEDSGGDRNQNLETATDVFEAFPTKLYRIIHEAASNGQDDIISFFPHGRAFVIHKPRAFVTDIMPKYFTTSRISSFQRQLNLYGFKRITEGADMGGYCHPYFINDHPNLLRKIKRKRYNNPKKREEPGFAGYGVPGVPPDHVQASLLMDRAALIQMRREVALHRQEQARALAMMQMGHSA